MTKSFKIYYAVLPSTRITNCVAPGYRHVTGANTPEGVAKRNKAQADYITSLNKKNKFYIKLEESINRDGILNPVLIQAGYCTEIYRKYLPEEHQKDLSKCLCCDRNGGSRLFIAQKLGLDVPCIISDFSSMFKDSGFEELHTKEDIFRKFKVRPKNIIINQAGVHVGQPKQVHLEADNKWRHLLRDSTDQNIK